MVILTYKARNLIEVYNAMIYVDDAHGDGVLVETKKAKALLITMVSKAKFKLKWTHSVKQWVLSVVPLQVPKT